VPRVCQFTEILRCPEYVNLQRFRLDFMVLKYVNLQRFYGAPSMSIYRDLAEISWCPESIYRDFMMPQVCQFTEILHDQANHVKSL